ncbi:hypothetical protein [Streptomyces sp. NPDC088847]|uniref:hypothetical protein n=1 Tax=Streptomyces sp. NPDC088847 TaxID=3365909 RepID=UPI00382FCEB4
MSNTTAKAAKLLVLLVEAEALVAETRKAETRTAKAAERAAARVHKQRAVHAEAGKEFNKAERAGKGVVAAARKATRQWEKLKSLQDAAKAAKVEATVARRAARAATRRLDRLSLRAGIAAARTVEKISQRLGETSLTPVAETDAILAADEIPTVEEIELHASRYATLDRQAKDTAKAADAEKAWLRTLPVGMYGRVVITRTPGRSVLDGTQVALDYTARGLTAPRKATRTTFKCDATTLLADLADVVETADDLGVTLVA